LDKIREKILEGLSREQRDAVLSDTPATRVLACAGAGKTETMARRTVLAIHQGARPESIAAFTFTERAANGLKQRILERTGRLLGEDVRDRIGALRVGTIHAFCFDLLRDHGGLGHFDLLDEHQERAFLSRHGWELGFKTLGEDLLGERVPLHRALELFRSSAAATYNEVIDRAVLRRKSPAFTKYLEAYERLLEDYRLLTFDRVIAQAVDLLRRQPDRRPPLAHLLIDEYQDVNPAQEELVRLLTGKETSLFVVGDPHQCIYEWRGSDPTCFERFTRRFKGVRTLTLSENRRSRPEIVDAANAYGTTMAPGAWTAMTAARTDAANAVWFTPFPAEGDEAAWVVEKIKRHAAEGRPLRDYAILLGSVDTAGAEFIDRLRDEGIPFEVGGRSGLFRHDAAQAVGRLFAWFAGHYWSEDRYDASQNLTGDDVLRSALEDFHGKSDAALRANMRRLKKEAQEGRFANLTELYQEVLVALGMPKLDPDKREHAAVISVYGRFNALLNDYEAMVRRVSADPARGRGSRNLDWPRTLEGLAWYITLYATRSYDENAADDSTGVDAVQIATIHQSKGLEWPVVFMPSLLGRRFPTKVRSDRDPWLLDDSLFNAARYRGDETSRRRVLYVGLTRARDGAFVSWHTSSHGKRSYFLDPIEANLHPPAATLSTRVPPETARRALERHLRAFTPTELIAYRRCPYRYRLTEVFGFQAGLTPELGFGRAHHHILRSLAEKALLGAKIDAAAVEKELDSAFYLPHAPAKLREVMRQSAGHRILEYVATHAADLARTVEVEARLEYPVNGALLRGATDVLLADGDALEVRDYKTSEDEVREEEADFQVRLYAAGLRKSGRRVSKASVSDLSTAIDRSVDVSGPRLRMAESDAEGTIREVQAGRFPARPGKACDRCDFARICKYR
jgi:DNA helicase II / ATP-dependent DNA helicase PcrA